MTSLTVASDATVRDEQRVGLRIEEGAGETEFAAHVAPPAGEY